MRVNDTFMHTHISTYTHTHTHVLMSKQYMHRAELWVCGKQITIQCHTNHTVELGPFLLEQVGEAGLAKDGAPFTSQRASQEWSSPSVCLTLDMAAIHREI